MAETRDQPKHVIYQLVVRLFSNTNTTNQPNGTLEVNGCGKFDDITPASLDSLRDLGITHIWLTGVLRQATLTDYTSLDMPPDDPDVVKGIAGSFYAVRDYFDVCPDYANEPAHRLAEFSALLQRIHDAGLKAIIDLVPNHVARGYASIVRPELDFGRGDDTSRFFARDNHFFYLVEPPGQALQLAKPDAWNPPGVVFDGRFDREDGTPHRPPKATGNNCASPRPSVNDWYETVKLNYGYDFATGTPHYGPGQPRPCTWEVVDEILGYWQALGVDGFRCDFAHYIPPEAWAFLITRARERDPDALFIAEAYPWQGSGDPVTDASQLVGAGFNGFYHYQAYNAIKSVYQGSASQDDYNESLISLSADLAPSAVRYLENHDERRIASPVVHHVPSGESGFGGMNASYLLAPLHLLSGPGPVIVFNGQEVGERGEGAAGFAGNNGRTTVFDYWSMPAVTRWVNQHRYDGGGLTAEEQCLRRFYGELLALCQHECVRGEGFWGLKYWNRRDRFADCPDALFSFARYRKGGVRMLLVVGNFDRHAPVSGRIRLPMALLDQLALPTSLRLTRRLGPSDSHERDITVAKPTLVQHGIVVHLPPESACVYELG